MPSPTRIEYQPALRYAYPNRPTAAALYGQASASSGFAHGVGDEPTGAVGVDEDGRLVSFRTADGDAAWMTEEGSAVVGSGTVLVPSAGFLAANDDEPAGAVEVDGAGRSKALAPTVPSAGWLSDDEDSLVTDAEVDAEGRLIRAHGAMVSAYLAPIFAPTLSGAVGRVDAVAPASPITVAGATAMLPPSRMMLGGRVVDIPAYAVTSPAPATEAKTDTLNIVYADDNTLTYQFARGVTVTTNPGGVVKTAGVDYRVDDRGAIRGLVNTANYLVNVDYTGHKQRIDYVTMNVSTGAMTLRQGAEQVRNADYFPPAVPATDVVVWRLFRHADGFVAMPVHLFRGRVRADAAGKTEAMIAEGRRRLARFFRRKATASTMKIGATGDSITQMGATGNPAEVNTVANGPRDMITYFTWHTAAALATIPTFDTGDGRGQVHVEKGWSWAVVHHLESLGITVDWRNWGIGGTDSSATTTGSGFHNGSQTDRLSATVADACDLMIVGFGMNELGSTSTYGNLLTIGSAFLAAGTDVILVTPPRPNVLWPSAAAIASWRFTCSEIVRAADALGVAYIDTPRLHDPANLSALALTEYELATAGMKNHADAVELAAIGDLLLELVA